MDLRVTGLDELIRQAEQIATEKDLEEVDKMAIKECLEDVEPLVKSGARTSRDVMKSGRKGSRSGIHYKNAIKTKLSRFKGKAVGYVHVGNGKGNNKWFYSKWDEFNYGTSQYPPNQPFRKAFKKKRKEWDEIFKKQYEQLINRLNN